MKMQILAGAAVLALIAGGASAATHTHKGGQKSAGAYAPPSQPVAYSKLDAYLKVAPTKRAKQDWSLASAAPTGATANTSATAPQSGAAPDTAPPAAPDAATAPLAPSAPTAPPAPAAPAAPAGTPTTPGT
jgi:hypothetical protein